MLINLRVLRAIRLGLQHFQHSLQGQSVVTYSDNATALSYIKKQGRTFSWTLNAEAQHLLDWAVSGHLSGVPVHHGVEKCGGRSP